MVGNLNIAHAAIHPNPDREAIVQAKEVRVQLKLPVAATSHGAVANAPMNEEAADLQQQAESEKAVLTENAHKLYITQQTDHFLME